MEEHIPKTKYLNKQSSSAQMYSSEGKHLCLKTMILNHAHLEQNS
jgi:hypothetical protein